MDLILGLPGELEADVQRTIEKIVELAPDSLTVHSLAIKRASRLNQWIQENGVSMLHNTDETMKIAAAGAEQLGMKPYYLDVYKRQVLLPQGRAVKYGTCY